MMNITLTPVSMALIFGGACILLALYLRAKRDGYLAARYLVENQTRPAREDELAGYLKMAEGDGRLDAFLRELTAIRRAYGHSGVKLGHLTWIDLKLDGRIPQDAVAPAFETARRDKT